MAKFNEWVAVTDDTIAVVGGTPKNTKKLTGTRLGAILGLNKWKTPFGAWCEIMRVAEPPFEGNKYTEAGNVLEAKLIEFCKTEVSPHILTPEEHFKSKRKLYDHFPNEPVLGGMWDGLVFDDGEPIGIIEAKTSSRPQDWMQGVPLSYAIQGLTYAHLMGVTRVFFPVRFMEPGELDMFDNWLKKQITREAYDEFIATLECTPDNTVVYELNTETWTHEGQTVAQLLDSVLGWYEKHVVGNVSPPLDKKLDKEYLAIMGRNEVVDDSLEALAIEVAEIETKLEVLREQHGIDDLEKKLKALKDKRLKPALMERFTDTDDSVVGYGWQVTRSYAESIDKEAMAQDNILDKYTVSKPKYTLTKFKEKANGNSSR